MGLERESRSDVLSSLCFQRQEFQQGPPHVGAEIDSRVKSHLDNPLRQHLQHFVLSEKSTASIGCERRSVTL